MSDILAVTSIAGEVVLSERVVSTEFKILEINEQVQNRRVRVEVEMGPFVSETDPMGNVTTRGTSRRGIEVWSNEDYDAVRDIWRNMDLIAKVKSILEA